MQEHGYKDLAGFYDMVYDKKDYAKEVEFLKSLFRRYKVKTVLDAGCGTGTHMKLLEKAGYACEGIDLNQEMLDVAKSKVKGALIQADMTDFNLGKKYDAIICMFAAFNHLLEIDYARKAIDCFKNHLNSGGILLIDLHNPQGNGSKKENIGDITREIEWKYDPETRIEKSTVVFLIKGEKIRDRHTMKIYSINEMLEMVKYAGFSKSKVYENYSFKSGQPTSKNLEVFASMN